MADFRRVFADERCCASCRRLADSGLALPLLLAESAAVQMHLTTLLTANRMMVSCFGVCALGPCAFSLASFALTDQVAVDDGGRVQKLLAIASIR